MLKRVLVLFVVVALVNATMYCTRKVRKEPDDLSRRLEKITGLILPGNDTLRFSAEGASYNPRSGFVVGVSDEGKDVGINIRELDMILVERSSDGEPAEIGVTPRKYVQRDKSVRKTNIAGVVLKSGESITFSESGGRYDDEKNIIVGTDERFMPREIDINEVDYVYVRQANTFGTIAAVAVVAAAVTVIILVIADEDPEPAPATSGSGGQSCPFVYSWTGTEFALDAEPLTGATNRSLARTDYSVLELGVPTAGGYDLLITNEMLEKQYLDHMSLLIVTHPDSTAVAPDLDGNFLTYADPRAPIRAIDELGRSLLDRVRENDGVYWQSEMALPAADEEFTPRHDLTFEFAVPTGATRGRLVYRVGTSLWGAEMVRKMYEARGNELQSWYREMEAGSMQAFQALQFLDREELYWLKLEVGGEESRWVGGVLAGGGPFVTELRTIDISIPENIGATMTLKLRPPRGFWTIDYLGMDFGDYGEATATEIPLSAAIDESGRDVSMKLQAQDEDYYVMPATDTWAKLSYDVSPVLLEQHHTVALKSTGYYQLILPEKGPADTALISRMLQTPGAIVRHSLEEYARWQDSLNAVIALE